MIKQPVLITGASSGLGVYLSDEFEKHGHQVIRHGGRKDLDLSIIEDLEKLSELALEKGVKILVNNAAIGCPNKNFENYTIKEINYMIDVNLRAPLILSYLLSANLNNIININSMVGLEIKKPRTLYSATKWGLRGFSNSYKFENENIKMLDVYPTNIRTKPERTNAMDPIEVVRKIYESFENNEEKLILDGRPK